MSWKDFVENVRTPGFVTDAVTEFKQINRELCEDLADVFRNEGVEVADAVGDMLGKTCVAVTTGTMDAYNDPIGEPLPGTPVYCLFEKGQTRAGIHAGGGKVLYYDQFGLVDIADALTFATAPDTFVQPDFIYCCCDGDDSEGSAEVFGRGMVYNNEFCNNTFRNDLNFVWYALTGEIPDSDKSLNDIKDSISGHKIEWRPWYYTAESSSNDDDNEEQTTLAYNENDGEVDHE